jgi:hypothetical protein
MKRKKDVEGEDVHVVWHRFQRRFKTDTGKYKLKGWALMKAIAKWAKRYPTDVFITGCDDAFFAGSDLVFIEHQSPNTYMGTTVLYIPQCTGEEPIEFFLYPGHRKNLVEVLSKLNKTKGLT